MRASDLKRIDEVRWEIPADYKKGMRVPARIFADERLLNAIDESAFEQISNAAFLPGVVQHTLAMPDIHSGYGLPIGGVMAMDIRTGVVSPGAAGYDINCGVRLIRTPLVREQVAGKIANLADMLNRKIPSGIGKGGPLDLSRNEFDEMISRGSAWAVEKGYGTKEDLQCTEGEGCMDGADPDKVSKEAVKRGRNTFGSLGSGNHFCEIQYLDEIFLPETASAFGMEKGQVFVMIHTGSRGFGHQVATDYLRNMERTMKKYGIVVPDRQLACAPIDSTEGKEYMAAMSAAANFAWANRQILTFLVREFLADEFGINDPAETGLIYDVAHNIIKPEKHIVEGKMKNLLVHRKGATRAFAPGRKELPEKYKTTGQPILVPGDMGRMSYVLAGAEGAMTESFGSTCHGAGRRMSRHKAMKDTKSAKVKAELAGRGIEVRAAGKRTLAEEKPEAYKDVSNVVEVVNKAGLAKTVARLKPMVVVKG